jgi:hypothetical protein
VEKVDRWHIHVATLVQIPNAWVNMAHRFEGRVSCHHGVKRYIKPAYWRFRLLSFEYLSPDSVREKRVMKIPTHVHVASNPEIRLR